MSSRWGSEEIDRVKGVSTPSPSRTVNDAYAARDITVMSSRWGSEEIDRVTGTAVTLLVETPELSSERDGLVSDLRTEMAGLEAQLKDATKQVILVPSIYLQPLLIAHLFDACWSNPFSDFCLPPDRVAQETAGHF
jgi:hypothetical protein